jgi:hypothetical protein
MVAKSSKTVKTESTESAQSTPKTLRAEDLRAIATALRAVPTSAATNEALARVEAKLAGPTKPYQLKQAAIRAEAKIKREALLAQKRTIKSDAKAEAKRALTERYADIDAELKKLHDARKGKTS